MLSLIQYIHDSIYLVMRYKYHWEMIYDQPPLKQMFEYPALQLAKHNVGNKPN